MAFPANTRSNQCITRIPLSFKRITRHRTTQLATSYIERSLEILYKTFRRSNRRIALKTRSNFFLIRAGRALRLVFICSGTFGSASHVFADSSLAGNEYVYQAKAGQRVDVFDLTKPFVYFESAEYLARRDGRHSGDLGGKVILCSNARYFCIRGGIYAAIPRELSKQTSWKRGGLSCHSQLGLSDKIKNDVTCALNGAATSFVYDKSRGILSYGSSAHMPDEFELVGTCGLFASDCTSGPQSPSS